MEILVTIVVFLLVLMGLVLIHELGHFWVAKWAGVRVDEFGLGLPPKLWGKQRGETEYTLNLLPIGGFVRMYGEMPDGVTVDSVDDAEVASSDDKERMFSSKPKRWRAAILLAGVAANMVLAMVLFTIVFTVGISQWVPNGSIEGVSANSPAAEAGLRKGDSIVALNGVAFDKVEPSFSQKIYELRGQEISLRLQDKAGEEREVSVTPRVEAPEDQGSLGVQLGVAEEKLRYPIWTAWWEGTKQAFDFAGLILSSLGGMLGNWVAHGDAPKDVSGPVGIATMVGQAREAGVIPLLYFSGLISVNLAVINLLPLPALDGGRLLFVGIEAVARRKVSARVEAITHTIGMMVLLGLILLITASDVFKLIK